MSNSPSYPINTQLAGPSDSLVAEIWGQLADSNQVHRYSFDRAQLSNPPSDSLIQDIKHGLASWPGPPMQIGGENQSLRGTDIEGYKAVPAGARLQDVFDFGPPLDRLDFGQRYDPAPNGGGTPTGFNSFSGSGCLSEEPSPLVTKGQNSTIAQAPRGFACTYMPLSGNGPLFGSIVVYYPEEFRVLPRIFLPHGDVASRMEARPNVASEWRLSGHLVTVTFADDAGIAPRTFHAQDQTYRPARQLPLCVTNMSTVLMRNTRETV